MMAGCLLPVRHHDPKLLSAGQLFLSDFRGFDARAGSFSEKQIPGQAQKDQRKDLSEIGR